MCGFIGQVSLNNIHPDLLNKPNDRIICRGPDGCKKEHFSNNSVNYSLIFNRLRILDLSTTADQPMRSIKDKSLIMFNGEIFNYQELRKKLVNQGSRFFTERSDTEVILNGLDIFGKKFIDQLRGQFAIFYVNFDKGEILLSRDRLGQKPLYYAINDNTFSFSSNLKSLTETIADQQIDYSQITNYINFGVVPSPHTPYKNIYKLEAGENLIISINLNNFSFVKEKYWSPVNFIDDKTFETEEFFNIFTDSVTLRKDADVEVATFLSGGIDSTSIIKNMYDSGHKINSFSVSVPNSKYDESLWANQVASKYSTNHTSINVSSNLSFEDIREALSSLDEPYSDPSVVPSYFLTKEMSKHFKVGISGDGGDELLGGYERIVKTVDYKNRFLDIFSKVDYLYPSFLGSGNRFLSKSKDIDTRYKSFLEDRKFLKLLDIDLVTNNNFLTLDNRFSDYKNVLLKEYSFFLSEMMLLKVDRTSMKNSIEVRSPFLDHKLIEYIFSHNTNYVNHLEPKQILKKYLSSDFNNKFLQRKKQGFVFNLEDFIYNNKNQIFDILNSGEISSYLNMKKLNLLNINKSRINSQRIWKLLVLSNFFENS
jgi:asparagine synthase (glutamine-hydrolysing)